MQVATGNPAATVFHIQGGAVAEDGQLTDVAGVAAGALGLDEVGEHGAGCEWIRRCGG